MNGEVKKTAELIKKIDKKVFRLREKIVTTCPNSKRGRPSKQNGPIQRTIMLCGVTGAKSILDCEDKVKELGNILKMPKVSSSTLHNYIAETTPEQTREYSYAFARMLKEEGKIYTKLVNSFKPHVIALHCDGTKVMTHYGVSGTFGGMINYAPDFVPCDGPGQEPEKALEICQRAKSEGIPVDIVTMDAIGYNRNFFKDIKDIGTDYLVRVRSDDEREPEIIETFEHAIKMEGIFKIEPTQVVKIYGNIKFTVRAIYTTFKIDSKTEHSVIIARIDSEPIKARKSKQKKKKKKKKTGARGAEEETTWEKMQREPMTHYVITSAIYLAPIDILGICIEHWSIETLFRKIKRAFWSRNSYKKNIEEAITLFISVCMGIATTEMIKFDVLLSDEQEIIENLGVILPYRPQKIKRRTLGRVRNFANRISKSRYFKIKPES